MRKLNRRSVGTQSDQQIKLPDGSGGGVTTGRKHFDITGKFSHLCKKSAYRNLLQRSITVDAHGKVNLSSYFIKTGRSRGTQTNLPEESDDSPEDRIQGEETIRVAIPSPNNLNVSGTSAFLSQGSSRASYYYHFQDKPGTSSVAQSESVNLQTEDGNLTGVEEGSISVIYGRDDIASHHSKISLMVHTYENQQSLRGQSNEAVLLVQDYQSYDVMNAARRSENASAMTQNPRKSPWKRSKRGRKKSGAARPVTIFPDASIQTIFACRICHEGEDAEPLIRPCLCKGSVGYIHAKCLKIWLEQSNMSRCEICGYPYTILQTKKYTKISSVSVFIRSVADRRALLYDMVSLLAVTPLCIIGIAMCIRASVASVSKDPVPGTNFQMGNVTRAGMIMLTTTIIVAYGVWLYTLLSYHYKSWKRWYNTCYEVEVIPVNLTSQERLETLQRLEEERRRRPTRVQEEEHPQSEQPPNNNDFHIPYRNFFQRRPFAAGRVQSLPQ